MGRTAERSLSICGLGLLSLAAHERLAWAAKGYLQEAQSRRRPLVGLVTETWLVHDGDLHCTARKVRRLCHQRT